MTGSDERLRDELEQPRRARVPGVCGREAAAALPIRIAPASKGVLDGRDELVDPAGERHIGRERREIRVAARDDRLPRREVLVHLEWEAAPAVVVPAVRAEADVERGDVA